MRPIYAVQFEVAPREENGNKNEVTHAVLRCLASWISEWYLFRKRVSLDFPLDGATLRPCQGHELTVTRKIHAEGVEHSTVSWSYPGEPDGNLLWHTRCEVSSFGGLIEFSLQLFLESLQFYIAPVDFDLKRPRVIATLLREFRCTHGDTTLTLQPRDLCADSVTGFVSNCLLSRGRRLPIVAVSRTPISEKWLVDPEALADPVAGIAEVHILEDKWAGFALSQEVGKLYSCYNGAVRLYWPDFDPAQLPYSPVYVPERVQSLGGRLVEIIFRQLAAISAFRFAPGPVTVDALDFLAERQRSELEQIRKAAQDRGDYEQLLEVSDRENAELRRIAELLRDENTDLRSKLQLSQENLAAIWQTQEAGIEPADAEVLGEEETETTCVKDVILTAEPKFAGTLVFLESALSSAEASPFKQPKRVLEALLAMDEVCQAWRKSRREKTTIGSFEQQFQKKGFVYKARESMTSRGKWSEEYEAIYNGRRVSIEPHLALGKGGPDTCLRIHFHVDEDEEKFVIAHVGRHKTNTSA